MIIDTHSHLNFKAFEKDLDEVVKRSFSEEVWMINVGSKYETSKKAIKIAEQYPKGVYAAVGLHPIHVAGKIAGFKTDEEEGGFNVKGEVFDKERYRKLALSEKVVAIGEAGLDYYYAPKNKEQMPLLKKEQEEALSEQLDLAEELDLPVIFHCRKAHNDLIELLKKRSLRGVIHCFTGKWSQAKEYLEMGFYLGFNGIIYKLNLEKTIEKTPLEKILIETDCPYLTPSQAKVSRNEPMFVKYVAEKIAEIKGVDYEEAARIATENARSLFKIKESQIV